jgi:hypothetical protein
MVYADRKARGVCDTRIKKAEDDYATNAPILIGAVNRS